MTKLGGLVLLTRRWRVGWLLGGRSGLGGRWRLGCGSLAIIRCAVSLDGRAVWVGSRSLEEVIEVLPDEISLLFVDGVRPVGSRCDSVGNGAADDTDRVVRPGPISLQRHPGVSVERP